jgi:type I restriction enzyme S subunit
VLFDLDGEFYFGNFISRLRCKSEIEPEFVFYQLFFLHLKGLTLSLQDQTTGIRNLRFSEYLKLPILVPALDIQRHIVAELSEKMAGAERLKATIEKQLETIKALPQAILRKAFSGEL